MIYSQNVGTKVMVKPVSVATNADSFGYIDTKGADYLAVTFALDTAAATSSNPSTLKLGESDDTVTTNFTDITAFVGDTAFTIPNASTSAPQTVRLNVNLIGRKRYIGATLRAAGAAQLCSVVGSLSRAEDSTVIRAKNAITVDG